MRSKADTSPYPAVGGNPSAARVPLQVVALAHVAVGSTAFRLVRRYHRRGAGTVLDTLVVTAGVVAGPERALPGRVEDKLKPNATRPPRSPVITAIVLLESRPDRIPEVAAEVAGIKGVREVYSVTGDVDLVAIVRVEQQDDLADIIAGHLGKVEGVQHMRTYLAFRTYSPADIDDALSSGFGDG
jgi:DNA-binding Lrp family transcriptional regulator